MKQSSLIARLLRNLEMSESELINNVVMTYRAGIHTTANNLALLFFNLATFQDAQEKLALELKTVLNGGDFNEYLEDQLPYLKNSLFECYRLNSVTLGNPRTLREDVKLSTGLSLLFYFLCYFYSIFILFICYFVETKTK